MSQCNFSHHISHKDGCGSAFGRTHWGGGLIVTATARPRIKVIYNCVLGATAPQWATAFSFTRFLDHTQRRATVGRTPLY